MDENMSATIIAQRRKELHNAAEDIYEKNKELAAANRMIWALKDDLALADAKIRVSVATAVNPQTNRPKFPNLDTQNARVLVELAENEDTAAMKAALYDAEYNKALINAKLMRLHELRHDIRIEVEDVRNDRGA